MYRIEEQEIIVNKIKCILSCDSKSDITDNMQVEGMDMIPFSIAYTKTLDVGILGSDGVWVWN